MDVLPVKAQPLPSKKALVVPPVAICTRPETSLYKPLLIAPKAIPTALALLVDGKKIVLAQPMPPAKIAEAVPVPVAAVVSVKFAVVPLIAPGLVAPIAPGAAQFTSELSSNPLLPVSGTLLASVAPAETSTVAIHCRMLFDNARILLIATYVTGTKPENSNITEPVAEP